MLLTLILFAAFLHTAAAGGVEALVKNQHNQQCMDLSTNKVGANVYIHPCHGRNNQKWIWDCRTGEIKSVANRDLCLDYDVPSKNVQVWSCSGGKNQRWRWAGGEIISQVDNRCIDMGGDKNLYMHVCHGGKNQKFIAPRDFQCVGVTFGRSDPPGRPINEKPEIKEDL